MMYSKTFLVVFFGAICCSRAISTAAETDSSIMEQTARMRIPFIEVELTWRSNDDLDMEVTEPSGNVIRRMNPNSKTGGKLVKSNNNKGKCRKTPSRKRSTELVRFPRGSSLKSGIYKIKLRHTTNCDQGATNWRVRVKVHGKRVLNKNGRSNRSPSGVINNFQFRYP